MTGPSSLAFPGSRKLAGWWRQLAPFEPQAFWVGHLVLHQVEALVRLTRTSPLDPFSLLVLKALGLTAPGPSGRPLSAPEVLEQLNDRLHLGRQVLRRVLAGMEAEGLVQTDPAGSWSVSSLGHHALKHREFPRPVHERRTFHFVDRGEGGAAPGSAHFLAVHNSSGIPWPAADGSTFDIRALQACLVQPVEWKQKHGFPLDVQEILSFPPEEERANRGQGADYPGAGNSALPSGSEPSPWQRVILDRPEWLLAVLVSAAGPDGRPQLVGLPVRQEGWVLQAGAPLFTLRESWQEIFPELGEEPSEETWRLAWRAWCEQRALPAAEAAACSVERQGERLRLTAPGALVERLRAARSDVLKGETWLLAGEGRIRPAALVELVTG
jgi:hypothetical protein